MYNVRDGEDSKIDICDDKFAAVGSDWKPLAVGLNCKIRMVRRAARAIFKKRLFDGQVR